MKLIIWFSLAIIYLLVIIKSKNDNKIYQEKLALRDINKICGTKNTLSLNVGNITCVNVEPFMVQRLYHVFCSEPYVKFDRVEIHYNTDNIAVINCKNLQDAENVKKDINNRINNIKLQGKTMLDIDCHGSYGKNEYDYYSFDTILNS